MSRPWIPVISDVTGRFVNASNATLLATTDNGHKVVYKPTAGERPLWDFPVETLAAREVLTYEVSQAMGHDIVPETVLGNGPYGPGSIQRYIDIDEGFDPVALVQQGSAELWPIAVLDVVTNNADRKLGHVISDGTRLLGIDHGLTFHDEDKLRTVLWVFGGRQLPHGERMALERLQTALRNGLSSRVDKLLGSRARASFESRVHGLIRNPVHPSPPDDRPPMPWPPY